MKPYRIFSFQAESRKHLLLHIESNWAEASPLEKWNQETFNDTLLQLQAIQQGWQGPLLPSVAFGLESLKNPITDHFSHPAALLLKGSFSEILSQADNALGFTHVKVKVGNLSLSEAISVVERLKKRFRLRIDINRQWSFNQALEFCQAFKPEEIEFLEDPTREFVALPMKIASDYPGAAIRVWKPTVWGPPPKEDVILSSAHETGVGIAHIARLAKKIGSPHPVGIGTYRFLPQDVLEEPLRLENGLVHVPLLKVKKQLLKEC